MKMKFTSGVSMLLIAALSQIAWADYINPPPFEPQRTLDWEFISPGNYEPITVTGPTWNQGDWACDDVTVTGALLWYQQAAAWPGHSGLIGIDNILGTDPLEGSITFHINNYDNNNPEKRLYFEILDYVIDGAGIDRNFSLPAGTTAYFVDGDGQWLTDGGYLYHGQWRFNTNPEWEEVTWLFQVPPGGQAYIDSFQVSTLCIPEPSTPVLLIMGALGLAFYGRRRR